ncbi:MAG: hypothetical protein Kow0013_03820 [Pararhodobacter sp.]
MAALGATLLAGAAALPASAYELSYGGTLTSNYISRGFTQTNHGVALQPWVEIGQDGFYGGIWMSNVTLGPDDLEVDLYGGYRWDVENTSFDIGYARYIYDSTGDAGGEFYFLAEHALGETAALSLGVYVGHSGGLSITDAHFGFSNQIYQNLTGSMNIGVASGGVLYGDVGVTYDFNDNISIDGRYYARANGIGRFVAAVSVSY